MIKINVNTWSLYNQGIIPMRWFDLENDTLEDIQAYISTYSNSGDELFIAGYEIDGLDIDLDECSPSYAYELYETLHGLESYELKAIAYLLYEGNTLDYAIANYDDVEVYADSTLLDLAYSFVEDGLYGEISPTIANYLDYDSIARDLGYDYVELNGDVYRAA